MRRLDPKPRLAALLGTMAALACFAAPMPAATPEADPVATDAKFVSSQWRSLYLAGKKIGYVTESLYALPDGGHRLQTNQFLRRGLGDEKFGCYRMITADVDASFRPKALTCRVASGERRWEVTGRAEQGVLVLTRTVGTRSASARIPLDEEVTFLSWALPATLMGGARTGEPRRWLVIDESLGALLPDPCLVQVLGPRGLPASGDGENLLGTAVGWVCGPERVAHLVDASGRVLRSVWQSTPMVAEATSLSEARRLDGPGEAPPGTEIHGLTGDRYRDRRLGLGLAVPAYPYVIHVADQLGAVKVTDLTDEASVSVSPAYGTESAATADETEGSLATHPVQQAWAARFDEVQAEVRPAAVPGGSRGGSVQAVGGTARLGCTTFYFRNLLVSGEGLTWFVSIAVADRDVTAKPVLLENVARSIRTETPEGRLPMQAMGLMLRSPFYGFEIGRPNPRWKVPGHVGGPMTALEIAREDQAAVALVRVFTPKKGETLAAFVAEQARAAAESLGVARPEPKPATLGGRKGLEISYEAKAILSGKPGRCTTVYAEQQGRVLALVLVVAAGADPAAAREVDEIRRSVKFLR